MVHPPLEQARWFEERLRYQILRFIFDSVGPGCDAIVTCRQIGVALGLRAEEVLRVAVWLDQHGYLRPIGPRPDFCLTPKAVTYFEEAPERRQSIRE